VQNLLKPDIGLLFWTVVTFLAMVVILKKLAWGPILKVLDDREEKIKNEAETARKNREEMERLKTEYENQLLRIEDRARALLSEAHQKGLEVRETILKEAEADARALLEKSRRQLVAEKDKLVLELRKDVGDLSLLATEKLLRQSVDKKVQERFIQDFLKNLESTGSTGQS
jgi:F-type H+-transporting ATPase subunit b